MTLKLPMITPKYAGMDRYEARKAIVSDLEAEGALVKIEDTATMLEHVIDAVQQLNQKYLLNGL